MALSERDRLALAVAYASTFLPSQKDIIELLRHAGVDNQTKVSRLLKYAQDNDWIKQVMLWENTMATHQERAEIQRLAFRERKDLETELDRVATRRNGVRIEDLVVIPESEGALAGSDVQDQFFANLAAQYLAPRLVEAKVCAVAWGRTLERLIRALQPQKLPNLIFVPMAGEPFNYGASASSPSLGARGLSLLFDSSVTLSLRGVPARIPADMNSHAAVIRRLCEKSLDYRRIFYGDESAPPLIEQVDTVLSGIGDAGTSQGDPWYTEVSQLEDQAELDKAAAGNLGGIWLPKDEFNLEHQKIVDGVNERSLGMKKKDLQSCAERARRNGSPGVVVFAVEPAKAGIVYRAVGLVNRLVISQRLAVALLDHARKA